MRVGPLRLCIMTLREEDPLRPPSDDAKKSALAFLKEETGQDFGLGADKWETWLKENKPQKYF